ncbi:unnamed protein product [Closterium sp. Naga37s-1]|nr:unnamed protein product [Closterium sp. Naga37s-1]
MAARRIPATVAALAAATAAGFASAVVVLVLSRPLHSLPAIIHAFLLRILRRITRTFLPDCSGFRLLHNTRSVLSALPVSLLPSSSNQNAPPAPHCRHNMDGCNSLLVVAPLDIDGFKAPPAAVATCCATGRTTPTTGRAIPATRMEPTSHTRDGPRAAIGRHKSHEASRKGRDGLVAAIGNTPLIRIASLSAATGCEIYGKAEFVNPGGSVKDRVALQIVQEALESGQLKPGGLITEGSAGSTGVALALVAAAFGCRCFVAMPDDAAVEKAEAMRALGAEVSTCAPGGHHMIHPPQALCERCECCKTVSRGGDSSESTHSPHPRLKSALLSPPSLLLAPPGGACAPGGHHPPHALCQRCTAESGWRVCALCPSPTPCTLSTLHGGEWVARVRPVSITHPMHFVNVARRRVGGACAPFDAFGTGPEIWRQTGGAVDAFVAAAGRHWGSIAGVSWGSIAGVSWGSIAGVSWGSIAGVSWGFIAGVSWGSIAGVSWGSIAGVSWGSIAGVSWGSIAGVSCGSIAGVSWGSIAGVSCYLKERNPAMNVYLIDPPVSSLFHKVTRGVLLTRQEVEGRQAVAQATPSTSSWVKSFSQGHPGSAVRSAGGGGEEAAQPHLWHNFPPFNSSFSIPLQEQNPGGKTFLIDPPGSSLFHKVTRGVLYTRQEAEGKRLRNPFDTITEGIGINRLTANFNAARIDGAFRGTDREAVEMARYLLRSDGLFIKSSSAMNCVGALRVAGREGLSETRPLRLPPRPLLCPQLPASHRDGLFIGSSSAMNCVGAVRVAENLALCDTSSLCPPLPCVPQLPASHSDGLCFIGSSSAMNSVGAVRVAEKLSLSHTSLPLTPAPCLPQLSAAQ